MANIQPTNTFTYPLGWNITSLEVTVNAFSLFPNTVEALWKLSGEDKTFSGSMTIPHEIVLQWGTDDSVLEDYVISQLNLTRAVVIEETSVTIPTDLASEEPLITIPTDLASEEPTTQVE